MTVTSGLHIQKDKVERQRKLKHLGARTASPPTVGFRVSIDGLVQSPEVKLSLVGKVMNLMMTSSFVFAARVKGTDLMKREWLLLALATAAVATALAQQSPSEGQKEQAAKKTASRSAHIRQPRSAAVFLRALKNVRVYSGGPSNFNGTVLVQKCQEVACPVRSNYRANGTQKHIISDGPRGRADFPRLKRVPHGVCQATSARV